MIFKNWRYQFIKIMITHIYTGKSRNRLLIASKINFAFCCMKQPLLDTAVVVRNNVWWTEKWCYSLYKLTCNGTHKKHTSSKKSKHFKSIFENVVSIFISLFSVFLSIYHDFTTGIIVDIESTVMILSFRADRPGQTVQTQIRLLLEEQSDQGLHCLPFRLHRLDSLVYGKAT